MTSDAVGAARLGVARPAPLPARDDAGDWRWQLRHAITTVEQLARHLVLSNAERAGAERALAGGLPLSVTPYYLSLCDPVDAGCPIRRQIVPSSAEAIETPGDLVDPLGEEAHEAAPRLIHRYPDRALIIVTDQCAVYCRFCTRSRIVGGGAGPATASALEPALAYLAEHREISEVILSGGDPLAMSTSRIVRLVERLRAIEHIGVIRLATRAPVCLPQRIDQGLVRALAPHHPLWVLTHFNHPRELTAEAAVALGVLADGGFPLMNQTVLLRGVNDDASVLEALFRGLTRLRVRPYYLHQMDPVRGTGHLRTPLERGVELMAELQGRLSGIALPRLVVDTPGGMGKVPLSPDFVVARGPGWTRLRTYRGVDVDYLDPPA